MEAQTFYQCKDCGLHYEDEETAQKCYEFCSKYQACSTEITKLSTEYKKAHQPEAQNPPL